MENSNYGVMFCDLIPSLVYSAFKTSVSKGSGATSESKFEQPSKYQRPQLPITYYATMLNPMSNVLKNTAL
ncbi:unnamed protein product [Caretta caretta]